jgi:hypothetical protein
MARYLITALSLAAVTLFGGCLGAYQLQPSTLEYIQSSDVVVVVQQQEINAAIPGSNVSMITGGGLIPALIDASIENDQAKTAEKLLGPIRDNLLDYDYPAVLKEKIDSALKEVDWLHAQQFAAVREAAPEQFRERYEQSNSSVILCITTAYQLTADFTGIHMLCNVDMWPKDEQLREVSGAAERKDPVSPNNRIYRGQVEVTKKLDVGKRKGKAAIETLAADNAAKVRQGLAETADEAAAVMVKDLNKAVGRGG